MNENRKPDAFLVSNWHFVIRCTLIIYHPLGDISRDIVGLQQVTHPAHRNRKLGDADKPLKTKQSRTGDILEQPDLNWQRMFKIAVIIFKNDLLFKIHGGRPA